MTSTWTNRYVVASLEQGTKERFKDIQQESHILIFLKVRQYEETNSKGFGSIFVFLRIRIQHFKISYNKGKKKPFRDFVLLFSKLFGCLLNLNCRKLILLSSYHRRKEKRTFQAFLLYFQN